MSDGRFRRLCQIPLRLANWTVIPLADVCIAVTARVSISECLLVQFLISVAAIAIATDGGHSVTHPKVPSESPSPPSLQVTTNCDGKRRWDDTLRIFGFCPYSCGCNDKSIGTNVERPCSYAEVGPLLASYYEFDEDSAAANSRSRRFDAACTVTIRKEESNTTMRYLLLPERDDDASAAASPLPPLDSADTKHVVFPLRERSDQNELISILYAIKSAMLKETPTTPPRKSRKSAGKGGRGRRAARSLFHGLARRVWKSLSVEELALVWIALTLQLLVVKSKRNCFSLVALFNLAVVAVGSAVHLVHGN